MTNKKLIRYGKEYLYDLETACCKIGDTHLAFVRNAIKALEQEHIKGHWIKEESPYGWDGHSYQCSECGRSIHLDTEVEDLEDYPYCHCGAEMQEVEE